MQDLARVRYVVVNYYSLQGLRLVPFGLGLFLVAVRDAGLDLAPAWLQPGRQDATLPAFVVIILLSWLAGVYYRRSFGRVERDDSGRVIALCALPGIAVFCAWWFANLLDVLLRPPVSLTGPAISASLGVCWWITGKVRLHYLLMAALLAVAVVLPLLGAPYDSRIFSETPGGSLILGVVFTGGGVCDHPLLVRTMKSLPEENGGGAV